MNKQTIKVLNRNDSLVNLVANMNTGTDRLQDSRHVANRVYSYEELAAIYEGWLGRKVVDLPPTEALKRGWEIFCPSWGPEKISMLNKYTDYLRLPELMYEALISERWGGGAIILAITDSTWGSMSNPVPHFLPKNSLLKLQMFDAWQANPAEINLMNPMLSNYLYPINYTIGAVGMSMVRGGENEFLSGSVVDHTRVQRFGGEYLPWYKRQNNFYWGQSILAKTYDAIRNAAIVDNSVASLIFRASVPVMKVKDLVNIVGDDESKAAFLNRMNILNYQMSNNNMAVVDTEEDLSNLELGSLGGLDPILERFYVTVSFASDIVVVKLVGESARGLNATGEGDLNNHYDMLEAFQDKKIKPRLMSMYKRWIVPSFFDELLPSDFEIVFPELERESPSKKQELNNNFLLMVSEALNNNLIDKKVARKELVERKIFKNFTKEDIKRIENETSENEIDLGDALDLADEVYKKDKNV